MSRGVTPKLSVPELLDSRLRRDRAAGASGSMALNEAQRKNMRTATSQVGHAVRGELRVRSGASVTDIEGAVQPPRELRGLVSCLRCERALPPPTGALPKAQAVHTAQLLCKHEARM